MVCEDTCDQGPPFRPCDNIDLNPKHSHAIYAITHLNGGQVLTGFLKCSPGSDSAFRSSLETTLIFFRLFVSRLVQAPSYLTRGQWTPPFVTPPASGACALTFVPSVPHLKHLPRKTEKHSVASVPLFDLKWMIYTELRKEKQKKSGNESESLFFW